MARANPDRDQLLRKAAEDLVESISQEEVPERIRKLAQQLGDALAGRKMKSAPVPGDEKA